MSKEHAWNRANSERHRLLDAIKLEQTRHEAEMRRLRDRLERANRELEAMMPKQESPR